MTDVLTMSDVVALNEVGRYAERGVTVRRYVEADDRIFEGVARSIGTDDGHGDFTSDVRDQHLRVTLLSGTDVYWPVRQLMSDVKTGLIAAKRSGS